MSLTLPVSIQSKTLPRAWLIVALLCVVGCLNYLDRIMLTTMRGSITGSIPMTDAEFGLLTSVFLWVYGLLSPFAGFLADKFNRSRVIICSLFLWSLVTWLTAHATSFNQLLITRALMGISEACYLPAALALITDYHRGSTRSMATGLHMAGVMVGQSLGFLGAWIADQSNWNNAFSIFGLIGIIYSVILGFLLRDVPRNTTQPVVVQKHSPTEKIKFFIGLKRLFSTRAFIMLLLFWSLLGIVGWMLLGWLPTYYKEHFNLSEAKAGLYATGYIHPVSLLGALIGGYITDRLSRNNPLGRILVPAVALLIAAPAIFIASNTEVVSITIIGFMFYAFTRIFSDINLMPILCMIADDRYRATGYGVLNMFACIVGGVGVFASGALRDADFQMDNLFKIAAGLLLLCVLVLFIIKSGLTRKGNSQLS